MELDFYVYFSRRAQHKFDYRNDLIQSHAYYFLPRILVHELPNDSVICSKWDRSPTPALILFFPLHSSLFSPSSFIRCPDKTFLPVIYRVTNGVPRGLYSRVAVTPLASSPWPAHAIYLSRLRDSSLRSPSFSPSHSSSRRLSCDGTLQPAHIAVASFAQRSPSSISFRGRRLFRAYFRYEPANRAARIFLGSGSSQFTGVSAIARVDVSAPICAESRIIPPRPRLSPILYRRAFQSDYRFDEPTTCFACCPPHGR